MEESYITQENDFINECGKATSSEKLQVLEEMYPQEIDINEFKSNLDLELSGLRYLKTDPKIYGEKFNCIDIS